MDVPKKSDQGQPRIGTAELDHSQSPNAGRSGNPRDSHLSARRGENFLRQTLTTLAPEGSGAGHIQTNLHGRFVQKVSQGKV